MTNGSVSQFFQLLGDTRRRSYPDLFFRGHQTRMPLVINLPGAAAKFLRIRLTKRECLHLEKVEVLAAGSTGTMNVSKDAELAVSSVLPSTERLMETRKLLDPNCTGLGIHTKAGDSEWVTLRWEESVNIVRVVIHNRDDLWAPRAWSMVVELSTDGDAWVEVYDHRARIVDFRRCVTEAVKHDGGELGGSPYAHLCVELLQRLLEGEHQKAVELLAARKPPKQVMDEVRNGFTDELLSSSSQEWTGHGIHRTFRFWSVQEKTEYLRRAALLVDDLHRLSPNVCLGFGFVLAYVRDGELIPYDDDIDVVISFPRASCPSLTKALLTVEGYLRDLGYTVKGNHFSHRWVSKAEANAFDVFVGLEEDDGSVSWFPSARSILKVTDIFPPLSIFLYDVQCRIPKNPVNYLERVYGTTWRSRDRNFAHPWKTQDYADIA